METERFAIVHCKINDKTLNMNTFKVHFISRMHLCLHTFIIDICAKRYDWWFWLIPVRVRERFFLCAQIIYVICNPRIWMICSYSKVSLDRKIHLNRIKFLHREITVTATTTSLCSYSSPHSVKSYDFFCSAIRLCSFG